MARREKQGSVEEPKRKAPSKAPAKRKAPSKAPAKRKAPSKAASKRKTPSKAPAKRKAPSNTPAERKAPSKAPVKREVQPTPPTPRPPVGPARLVRGYRCRAETFEDAVRLALARQSPGETATAWQSCVRNLFYARSGGDIATGWALSLWSRKRGKRIESVEIVLDLGFALSYHTKPSVFGDGEGLPDSLYPSELDDALSGLPVRGVDVAFAHWIHAKMGEVAEGIGAFDAKPLSELRWRGTVYVSFNSVEYKRGRDIEGKSGGPKRFSLDAPSDPGRKYTVLARYEQSIARFPQKSRRDGSLDTRYLGFLQAVRDRYRPDRWGAFGVEIMRFE